MICIIDWLVRSESQSESEGIFLLILVDMDYLVE